MSDEQTMTLGEVSKRVITAVGPARIAGFSLLSSHLLLERGESSPDLSSTIRTSMKRLEDAAKMLDEGVLRLMRDCEVSLQPAENAKRKAAHDAVAAMIAMVKVTDDSKRVSITDVDRFASKVLDTVDQTVTAFLEAFDISITGLDGIERQKERDVIKSAVGEIQTISMSINLISINASIEAARAGAAGRGFGVIANEIQTLSMRSQESLQKIMVNVADG